MAVLNERVQQYSLQMLYIDIAAELLSKQHMSFQEIRKSNLMHTMVDCSVLTHELQLTDVDRHCVMASQSWRHYICQQIGQQIGLEWVAEIAGAFTDSVHDPWGQISSGSHLGLCELQLRHSDTTPEIL